MTARELLSFLGTAARLKETPRHCVMPTGRVESVAEHCWRLALMAMLLAPAEGLDEKRLLELCLVHDLGEAVTGDIPTFVKTEKDRATEREAVLSLLGELPEPERTRLRALLVEFEAQETPEARYAKALDKCEALLSHNEADLATWLPLEYDLQLTYGQEECAAFPSTAALRQALEEDSRKKIGEEN